MKYVEKRTKKKLFHIGESNPALLGELIFTLGFS